MKIISAHKYTISVICACMLLLGSGLSYAQKDTVEFKYIPKYYPEDDPAFTRMPKAEIAYTPKLLFPADSALQGRKADVWVKVKVNEQGIVKNAEVFKSTDEAFNAYAVKYAREFKFTWAGKWPDNPHYETVWLSLPVRFRQSDSARVQASQDAIINDLKNLAAVAYQFRIRPTSMGGGGGSYVGGNGNWMPIKLMSTDNGTYTSTSEPQSVILVGTSSHGYGTVMAVCDSTGRLGNFTYTGRFR